MPDDEGCARFGIDAGSERGTLLRAGGFVEIDRYDGHTPPGPESGYADWLRARGYASADPWSDYVIAAEDRGAGRSAAGTCATRTFPRAWTRRIPRPLT